MYLWHGGFLLEKNDPGRHSHWSTFDHSLITNSCIPADSLLAVLGCWGERVLLVCQVTVMAFVRKF